jgi:hypothetical protein
MLTRRGLLAVLAGAVVDPERLIWRPGTKLISIPRPRVVIAEELEVIYVRPVLGAIANAIERELAAGLAHVFPPPPVLVVSHRVARDLAALASEPGVYTGRLGHRLDLTKRPV